MGNNFFENQMKVMDFLFIMSYRNICIRFFVDIDMYIIVYKYVYVVYMYIMYIN